MKVFVGGVNAVSGQSSKDNMANVLRRHNQLSQGQFIQNYLIPPHHAWLDGVAVQDGQVRQFVATPMGSGYSVEAQLTGDDSVGGLQFEVIPLKVHREPPTNGFISLTFRPQFQNGIETSFRVLTNTKLHNLFSYYCKQEGLEIESVRCFTSDGIRAHHHVHGT